MTTRAMLADVNHTEFWDLIDRARGERGVLVEAVARRLVKLPPEDIVAFDAWFRAYDAALIRHDVWAVFYIRARGCTDESFDEARRWLIGRGEEALLAAMRDPESLTAYAAEVRMRDEELHLAADRAHRKVTGAKLPAGAPLPAIPELASWPPDRIQDLTWTDDVFRAQLPKIYEWFVHRDALARARGTIDHARFWEMIAAARAGATEPTVEAVVASMIRVFNASSYEDTYGWQRWMQAYNRHLWREDLRDACRVILGDCELDAFMGFRGWLIAQGEAVVAAAVRDPDALATLATDPPAAASKMIAFGVEEFHHRRSSSPERGTDPEIPDRAAWPAPRPRIERYTAAELRARLPKLTTGRTDAELEGPCDPARLAEAERLHRAKLLHALAADCDDPRRAIALLTDALPLLPPHTPLAPHTPYDLISRELGHLAAAVLGLRANLHARLGAHDAAVADFDAALPFVDGKGPLALERAKSLLALGRTAEALASARAAATPEAQRWLAERERKGPPRRVRHAKFGVGTVLRIHGTEAEQKLDIDFGAAGKKTLMIRFVEVIE